MSKIHLVALCIVAALAAAPASAKMPRLKLAAPVSLLSAANPLGYGKSHDDVVEIELGGYYFDPPLPVPATPSQWPPRSDIVEVEQILAALRPALGIDDPIQVHAEAFVADLVVVLISSGVEAPGERRTIVLARLPDGSWTIDEEALADPVIEAVSASWYESGWIEVIPGDAAPPPTN